MTPSSTSSRPRLATSILRSNSQASTLTHQTGYSTDSVAVNPPSTRPVSPTASERSQASGVPSVTPDTSGINSAPPEGIPAPIVDKEEKFIRGYKNIPSLNAITERMRRAKLESDGKDTASGDATIVVTAPEIDVATPTAEEPASIAPTQDEPASGEHPLQHTWYVLCAHHQESMLIQYPGHCIMIPRTSLILRSLPTPNTPHSRRTRKGQHMRQVSQLLVNSKRSAQTAIPHASADSYQVEGFCRYFNWLKPPSKLERSSNYHLFKDGIKPMWEDPANAKGGKWVLTIKNNPQLLDRCWSWLAMALVGEELDEKDEICGAVVSLRAKIDRIQLWTRVKDDVESINALGKKFIKLLDVSDEPGIGLEFQVRPLWSLRAYKLITVE